MARSSDTMENQPPLTYRGEPLEKNLSPPPTTHIGNQGGGYLEFLSAHPGSLGERGWENEVNGDRKSPTHTHPRVIILANFCRHPGTSTSPGIVIRERMGRSQSLWALSSSSRKEERAWVELS